MQRGDKFYARKKIKVSLVAFKVVVLCSKKNQQATASRYVVTLTFTRSWKSSNTMNISLTYVSQKSIKFATINRIITNMFSLALCNPAMIPIWVKKNVKRKLQNLPMKCLWIFSPTLIPIADAEGGEIFC